MKEPTYLVATDLSTASRRGAKTAARLASRSGGRVDLFCAIPSDVMPDMEQFGQTVQAHLDGMARTIAKEGVEVTTATAVTNHHIRGILKHAERTEAAMIVIAPQSQNALRKFMLGSTTERLLRSAPALLLIARKTQFEKRPRVLLAVDRSPGGKRALRVGLEYCAMIDAEPIVLTVIPSPGAFIHVEEMLESASSHRRAAGRRKKAFAEFAEWVEQFPHEGRAVSIEVREGNPALEIVAEALARKVDLILMGTHGKNRAEKLLLGNVSHAVARRATQSVLLIRARPPKKKRKPAKRAKKTVSVPKAKAKTT
jgi:nucleotide-binding universal stress UspA family protein